MAEQTKALAARKAAINIREAFYAKDLDRGYGQNPPRMLLSDAEMAEIIVRALAEIEGEQ